MGEFSIYHWLVVIVILLIIFGPNRLPQLGQSLGKAIKGFKQSLKDVDEDVTSKSEDKKDDSKKS